MAGLALLFQSVAVSFDLDDVGVVQDAVEHRCSQCGVAAEGFIPLRKRKVAGQDHRAALVALGDDLEEVASLIPRERQIADLIDDEQPRAENVVPKNRVVSLLSARGLELQHQIRRRDELRLDAGLCRGIPDGDREVGLAHA